MNATAPDPLEAVLGHLKDNAEQALGRLGQLLAIPSVSMDSAYIGHIRVAADWVAQALRDAGLDAEVRQTKGHPVVIGRTARTDGPSLLFYGHYDVQPPDPLDEWTSPPFEPTVRDGHMYARGSSDDKGPVCCFIEALSAWNAVTGEPPANVTVFIEGEEEGGSTNTGDFIRKHKDELVPDPDNTFVLISDTTMWGPDLPTITCGLRGMLYFDIQLHGPSRDLHSGVYGGILANPINILTGVLGKLFDDQNRITIPGFYDDVLAVTKDEHVRWSKLGFDERAYLANVGVDTPFGEAGYETLERKWARPSCDINGICGGYSGEGAKTVIPTFAAAKVSFRLAPDQDPERIAVAFNAWLKSHDTGGCRWQVQELGRAHPVVVSNDSPHLASACNAVEAITGKTPTLVREGATIPVVADFKNHLGVESLMVGFGLESDQIHSPNERFAIDRFHMGCRIHAAILAELAAR